MQAGEGLSLEQIRAFLEASEEVQFEGRNREEVYGWVDQTLRRQGYEELGRAGRGLVHRYLEKMTGLSRAQVTRLVTQYLAREEVKPKRYRRRRFPTRCTRAVDRYIKAGAFAPPPKYEFGNTAPTLDWVPGWTAKAESFSIGKTIPIKERIRAQFRTDINNPFNFARWNNPNTSITSADYGRVTGSNEGRRVQLYLAVEF